MHDFSLILVLVQIYIYTYTETLISSLLCVWLLLLAVSQKSIYNDMKIFFLQQII